MAFPRAPAHDPDDVAIQALSFLAADPERLERFMALSGLTPETLRAAANGSGFLVAVLEHVLADESLVLAFAANAGLAPERIAAARAALAGVGG